MNAEEFYIALKSHLGFGQLWMCLDDSDSYTSLIVFEWYAPKASLKISWQMPQDVLLKGHCTAKHEAHYVAQRMRQWYREDRKAQAAQKVPA